jgi:hypothetical protein
MPTPSRASRRGGILVALVAASCARPAVSPPPDVLERARASVTYSGRLRVSLDGPELKARSAVLVGFRRPDALRIEVPGPAGARLIAIAHAGTLLAIFPAERAFLDGEATPQGLGRLLGVSLAPSEVMDLLVGTQPPAVRAYRVRWGTSLPRGFEATLPDGGRLKVTVDEAETGRDLPESAFSPPRHDGYRLVDAEEARRLWSR